jgi:hypothetical protein
VGEDAGVASPSSPGFDPTYLAERYGVTSSTSRVDDETGEIVWTRYLRGREDVTAEVLAGEGQGQ